MEDFERYWKQSREMWKSRTVGDFRGDCGFCEFSVEVHPDAKHEILPAWLKPACKSCPVFKVYGGFCDEVIVPMRIFYELQNNVGDEKKLRYLAQAVVQELDDKKMELVAAMRELWEEAMTKLDANSQGRATWD